MKSKSDSQRKKEEHPQDKKEITSARKRLDAIRKEALCLVQGELIGRSVTATPHKGGASVKGKIVDETRDTLVVETCRGRQASQAKLDAETKKKQARLIKEQHTFEFVSGKRRIKIKGSLIARRPEDRLKIKIRW